jgi:hypothetical protein
VASIYLPAPGTKYGPCPEPCQHRDCARTRADAAIECPYCHKAIGYERAACDAGDGLAHETCAYSHFRGAGA